MGIEAAVRDIPGGVRIALRAQPRSSRDAIVGPIDDGRGGIALKIAVTAPPVEGEANAAIVKLLAKLLGVPKSRVVIASGEGGRTKTVDVTGVDRAHVVARLSA